MNIQIIIVLLSIALGVLVFILAASVIRPSGRQEVKKRYSKYFRIDSTESIQDEVLKERAKRERKGMSGVRFISKEFAEAVGTSGIKLTPVEFLYTWIGSTLIPIVLFAIISGNIISVAAAGIIGLITPAIILNRATKKRQELFTMQLGEALAIIGNGLKAGFSFQQSMSSVAKEMSPPLSTEFEKTMREMQYGAPMDVALTHLNDRIKNQDLDIFISSVLTSVQVGSNLTELLDTISSTIKDRIRIKQEVRVLTASSRVSGIIIGLLPVFLVFVLAFINPDYFSSFFESNTGKIMVVIGTIMEVLGFAIIRKIADIKY